MKTLFQLLAILVGVFCIGCSEGSIDDPNNTPNGNDPKNIVPNDEIWYTNGSTTEPTTPTNPEEEYVWPYDPSIFGANIISNTYDANKECWVIKFDGEVTRVGEMAFWECLSITSVALPDSVTSINYSAFKGCVQLTTITYGNNVEIGSRAFYDCASLTDVVLSDGTTIIASGAFNGCTSLTNITIPDGVTTIGTGAFARCKSLSEITLPNSVTTIEDSTFYTCSNLSSITLGNSVVTIGGYAFFDCASLTSVYCKATTPPILGECAFDTYVDTIYVPTESVDTYKYAPGWSDYESKIVGFY